MLIAALLLLSPLAGAYLLMENTRNGFRYLAAAVSVTLCNGLAANYYYLSPDGGAPERAWLPAGLAFYFAWVTICVLVAIGLRSLTSEVEAGTGLSPGR